jgi:hypothetical protein
VGLTLAELRNRIAHFYPDENGKQAEILNEVHGRSKDLIEGYNEALRYADGKFFGDKLDVHLIVVPSVPTRNPAVMAEFSFLG